MTNMNKFTFVFALLMLTATGGTHACSNTRDADCTAATLLADASGDERMRFLESSEGGEQGPLSVRVTTFDGSPSSPGMWYERPRKELDDGIPQYRSDTPRAPFDRH
jgi:hypothetical protein